MLGPSGSGKTAFMIGLYRAMGLFSVTVDNTGGSRMGLSLCGDTDDRAKGIDWFFENDFDSTEWRWPIGTDEATIWQFGLEWNGLALSEWDWMDYPGGQIQKTIKNRTKKAPPEEIERRLESSEAVIVAVDSILYSNYKDDSMVSALSEAPLVNWVFENVFKTAKEFPKVVIFLLTKANSSLVDEKYRADNFLALRERTARIFEKSINLIKTRLPSTRCRILVTDVGQPGDIKDEFITTGERGIYSKVKSEIVRSPQSFRCEVPLLCCFEALLSEEFSDAKLRLDRQRRPIGKRFVSGVIDWAGKDNSRRRVPIEEARATAAMLGPVLEQLQRHSYENSWPVGYWS